MFWQSPAELAKLKAIDKISDFSAPVLSRLFAGAALFFFFLFASLGLAFWLGKILGQIYFGFLAVAAVYGLMALLIHLF